MRNLFHFRNAAKSSCTIREIIFEVVVLCKLKYNQYNSHIFPFTQSMFVLLLAKVCIASLSESFPCFSSRSPFISSAQQVEVWNVCKIFRHESELNLGNLWLEWWSEKLFNIFSFISAIELDNCSCKSNSIKKSNQNFSLYDSSQFEIYL